MPRFLEKEICENCRRFSLLNHYCYKFRMPRRGTAYPIRRNCFKNRKLPKYEREWLNARRDRILGRLEKRRIN